MLNVDAEVAAQRVESKPCEAADIIVVACVRHTEPRVCPNDIRERDHVLNRHSIGVGPVSELLAIAPSNIRLRVGVLPVLIGLYTSSEIEGHGGRDTWA